MKNNRKFWYIVWRGEAYYCGYKDKISDKWSTIPLEAKKYSSLGGAMTRLGLPSKILDIDKFWKEYGSESMVRNRKLEEVLSVKDGDNSRDIFRNGRIDIIYEDGEVIEFGGNLDAANKAESISLKTKRFIKGSYSDYESSNIIPHEEGTDFWEGF